MRKKRIPAAASAEDPANHARFMKRALTLARRGEGWTSPNPMVGSVVVRGGRVVGEGWHRRVGAEHAEAMALDRAGPAARGAILYVTLEPCNHAGRTPPCTEAIARSGVARVVIGMSDPNTDVRGGGAARLRARGIEVIHGVLESACRALNAPFLKQVTSGLPLVTLKCAMSLDGKVAFGRGLGGRLSGPEAARFVHMLRHASDAILIGVGTALADDPLLTARGPGRAKDPLRVVLDSRLRMSPRARMLHAGSPAGTVIATLSGAPRPREAMLRSLGVEVWRIPPREGRVDLSRVLAALGARDVQSVLIEGGPRVAAEALSRGLVDRLRILLAPILIGGDRTPGLLAAPLGKPLTLPGARTSRLGADLLVEADLTPAARGERPIGRARD